MTTAGTLSELASFPDSRLRILNAENGLLIMMESLDRVLAHYGVAGVSLGRFTQIESEAIDVGGYIHAFKLQMTALLLD